MMAWAAAGGLWQLTCSKAARYQGMRMHCACPLRLADRKGALACHTMRSSVRDHAGRDLAGGGKAIFP